jgi:hypothetical protein
MAFFLTSCLSLPDGSLFLLKAYVVSLVQQLWLRERAILVSPLASV